MYSFIFLYVVGSIYEVPCSKTYGVKFVRVNEEKNTK